MPDGPIAAPQILAETQAAKLKRARTSARFLNANDSAPLMPVPAYVASTPVVTGTLRNSGGNIYICVQSGTTGASTPPSGVATIAQTDGTAIWAFYGVSSTSVIDPTAPIVTTATALPGGFPTIYTTVANANANQLSYSGGSPTTSSFGAAKSASITSFNKAAANAVSNAGFQITTETSASQVLLAVGQNVGGLGQYNTLRVIIDSLDGKGQRYLNLDPFIIPVASLDPQYFITLDFRIVGGNKPRRITIEGQGINYGFHSFRLPATDIAWKPFYPDTSNLLYVSDSIGEGYANIAAGAANFIGADNAPNKVGKKLGFTNTVNVSQGGTGYLNNNTTGFTYRQRITSQLNPVVLSTQFDLIIFDGAIVNDLAVAGATPAILQAEALATFQQARLQWPNAVIWVVGGWPVGNPAGGSNFALFETALGAAFTKWGDSKSFYTSQYYDVAGSWLTGTGKASAPTGNGNNDYLTASDGVHVTDVGVVYRTNRLANAYDRDVLSNLK